MKFLLLRLGAGSSGSVRPEPLGPNRSSSTERPRDPPLALLEAKSEKEGARISAARGNGGNEVPAAEVGCGVLRLGPARTARPEPLELGQAAPRTECFFSVLTLQFVSPRFPLSPSPRALRAPRAGHVRHATTRTRVCHSAHHVAANQLANRV